MEVPMPRALSIGAMVLMFLFSSCGGGGGGGGDTSQGSGQGAPIATVSAAASITQDGATLNGSVTPNGLATQAWFEWGENPALSSFAPTPEQSLGSGTTSQLVSATLSGLSTGTTYYCRVAARNSSGTSKTTITSFTTSSLGAAPTVDTLAASSVAATSATLNGNVAPNGLATQAWFEWGTNPALSSYASTPVQSLGSGTTSLLVGAALSGLSTGTTYYCRVAASNSSGTSKGTIVSFTASPPEPDPGVADIRDEFLATVNQARSVNQVCGSTPYAPAPPVSWSENLAMAAYLHSEDMALNNFFDHTGSDDSSPGDRISRQGYVWRTYGENIAVGYPTVSSVIQGWLGSEGHCQNLMDPDFTEIGAGYAIGPYGGNPAARYWTFDLADR